MKVKSLGTSTVLFLQLQVLHYWFVMANNRQPQ